MPDWIIFNEPPAWHYQQQWGKTQFQGRNLTLEGV